MGNGDRWVSPIVSSVGLSAIKDMAMRSAKVEGAASLAWGLPSFRTPDNIRHGVALALDSDHDIGKYALPDGLPELRRLAAKTHAAATGVTVDADRNVLITAGNMQGMNALFRTIVEASDEVILTDPGFASHITQIILCGGVPVHWQLIEAEGWRLDIDALENLITPRTKAIVLVTPSNPTGTIFTEDQLRRVGEIALERDLLIILDDPYSHFVYENAERYFNLASVPDLANHVAYLFTFSKCHAMSGWRMAYSILPEQLKRQVLKVHDATLICAPRISQIAAMAALREDPVHIADFAAILEQRRDHICSRLDRVPDIFTYVRPEGAYYVFPRIEARHRNSKEFAIQLLENARVTVTPGRAFGPAGEHHVRMAYCVEDAVIDMAFDRIEAHFR